MVGIIRGRVPEQDSNKVEVGEEGQSRRLPQEIQRLHSWEMKRQDFARKGTKEKTIFKTAKKRRSRGKKRL